MSHLAGRPGLAFLEVGCFEGRASVWLLEHVLTHESSRLDCIDSFAGSVEHGPMGVDVARSEQRFDHNIRASGVTGKVTKIKGLSQEVLRRLPPQFYHFAYIDGSHLARDVLEDAVLSLRLLRPGGIMIFDDYNWNQYLRRPAAPQGGDRLLPDPLPRCDRDGGHRLPGRDPETRGRRGHHHRTRSGRSGEAASRSVDSSRMISIAKTGDGLSPGRRPEVMEAIVPVPGNCVLTSGPIRDLVRKGGPQGCGRLAAWVAGSTGIGFV